MAFRNYTFNVKRKSNKLSLIMVIGFITVITAVGVIMFYLGRQSVFDNYSVTPNGVR